MFERQAAIKVKQIDLRFFVKIKVTLLHNIPLGHAFSRGDNYLLGE
jgi:hypothetical protein